MGLNIVDINVFYSKFTKFSLIFVTFFTFLTFFKYFVERFFTSMI